MNDSLDVSSRLLIFVSLAASGRLRERQMIPSLPADFSGPSFTADEKLTPDGSLLLCANMPGNSLAVFRIDRDTGRLTPVGEPIAVKAPSSIAILPRASGL